MYRVTGPIQWTGELKAIPGLTAMDRQLISSIKNGILAIGSAVNGLEPVFWRQWLQLLVEMYSHANDSGVVDATYVRDMAVWLGKAEDVSHFNLVYRANTDTLPSIAYHRPC